MEANRLAAALASSRSRRRISSTARSILALNSQIRGAAERTACRTSSRSALRGTEDMSISTAAVPSLFKREIFSSPQGWVTAILDEEIHFPDLEMEVRYHLDMVAEFQRCTIEDDLALFGNQDFIPAMRGELAGNGESQFRLDDLLAKKMKRGLRAAAAGRAVVSEVRRLQIILEVCN